MEVFQPAKDDWSDPTFAPLSQAMAADGTLRGEFDQLQAFDKFVREMMWGTPVPPEVMVRLEAICSAFASRVEASEGLEPRAARSARLPGRSASEVPEIGWLGEEGGKSRGCLVAAPSVADGDAGKTDQFGTTTGRVKEVSPTTYRYRIAARKEARLGRRPLFVGIPLGAILAAVLVFCLAWPFVCVFSPGSGGSWSTTEVLHLAITKFWQDREAFWTGASVRESPPPAELPPSGQLRGIRHCRWRWTELRAGIQAVAYDLPSIGGQVATLYVAKLPIRNLPPFPPPAPDLNTGRCSAGMWLENGRAYILVVAGGPEVYRLFVLGATAQVA
jgi:hypothetical protein